MQIARDIQKSGRQAVPAVGSRTCVPHQYRGADIMTWMPLLGHLGKMYNDVDNLERVRSLPSFQLCGETNANSPDLNALQALGVEITGRFAGMSDGHAVFSGSLANVCIG